MSGPTLNETLCKLYVRRRRDCKFFGQRRLRYSEVATEYNLQKIIREMALCIDLVILKVKVPVKISGTEGFPARRDGR